MDRAHGNNAAKADVAHWLFGILVLVIGVANLLLVHPVPAVGYGLASLVYLPPARALLKQRLGCSVHPLVRIGLGIAIVMFTLGVSDLGDMIDGDGDGDGAGATRAASGFTADR